MLNLRKIKLLALVIFIAGVFFAAPVLSQDKKSPFKDCLPRAIEQPKAEQVMAEQVMAEEEMGDFNVSMYKINGLLWGAQETKAIINNEIYSVGDKLGEAKITKIDKNGVAVIFNNKEYILSLERKMDAGTKNRRARNEY